MGIIQHHPSSSLFYDDLMTHTIPWPITTNFFLFFDYISVVCVLLYDLGPEWWWRYYYVLRTQRFIYLIKLNRSIINQSKFNQKKTKMKLVNFFLHLSIYDDHIIVIIIITQNVIDENNSYDGWEKNFDISDKNISFNTICDRLAGIKFAFYVH